MMPPGVTVAPVHPSPAIVKWDGFAPVGLAEATTSGAVPVLVSFTTRAEVAVPSGIEPKPRLPGTMLTAATGT